MLKLRFDIRRFNISAFRHENLDPNALADTSYIHINKESNAFRGFNQSEAQSLGTMHKMSFEP